MKWSASSPVRFTPWERAFGTHWIRGWVNPRAGVDVLWRILHRNRQNGSLGPYFHCSTKKTPLTLSRRKKWKYFSIQCAPISERGLTAFFFSFFLYGSHAWPVCSHGHSNVCAPLVERHIGKPKSSEKNLYQWHKLYADWPGNEPGPVRTRS